MSRSGYANINREIGQKDVLIPLLVDVPLWVKVLELQRRRKWVLIPLLVDVPLWESTKNKRCGNMLVLIPLLVDVPLWAFYYETFNLFPWS